MVLNANIIIKSVNDMVISFRIKEPEYINIKLNLSA